MRHVLRDSTIIVVAMAPLPNGKTLLCQIDAKLVQQLLGEWLM